MTFFFLRNVLKIRNVQHVNERIGTFDHVPMENSLYDKGYKVIRQWGRYQETDM